MAGTLPRPGWNRITTTIPTKIYEAARERGVSFQSLMIDGWNAQHRQAALIARVRFLEQELQQLRGQLDRLGKEMWLSPGGLRLKR
jgi:hypothetical protein